MESAHEVTDSSDWLHTTLPTFSQLENSLRCQVCKDFFINPVITSCFHTFCSLCIRRCISSDGKCPACRASDQASKLRQNWAIEEVVSTFKAARPDALRLATERKQEEDDAATRPAKRRRTHKDEQSTPSSSQRQTRSRTKVQPSAPADIMVLDDDEEDGDYEQEVEPDDGLVACPICGGRMKEETVYLHTDTCDGTPPERKKSQTPVNPLQLRAPVRAPSQPQERIAELNYSMMTDTALRKKLKDIGISSSGPKQLMIRRHTEWANLWNSNCDSARPKSKAQLLNELDIWERSQGGQAKPSHGSVNGIMKKDFDARAYSDINKDDFARLVQEARRKAKSKETALEVQPEQISKPEEVNGPAQQDSNSKDEDVSVSPGRPALSQHNEHTSDTASNTHPKNEEMNHVTAATDMPVAGSQDEAPASQAHVGAEGRERRGSDTLGARFHAEPTRKVPMFSVSSQPVVDVDLGQDR